MNVRIVSPSSAHKPKSVALWLFDKGLRNLCSCWFEGPSSLGLGLSLQQIWEVAQVQTTTQMYKLWMCGVGGLCLFLSFKWGKGSRVRTGWGSGALPISRRLRSLQQSGPTGLPLPPHNYKCDWGFTTGDIPINQIKQCWEWGCTHGVRDGLATSTCPGKWAPNFRSNFPYLLLPRVIHFIADVWATECITPWGIKVIERHILPRWPHEEWGPQ